MNGKKLTYLKRWEDFGGLQNQEFCKKYQRQKNVEERTQLKPNNIKPIHEQNDFVKEKTSDEFKLLDYEGSAVVVAEGRWSSSDPKALAHHFSIGPKAMRIWVDVAKEHEKYLWRTTPYMT